jgi:hypothetical protein
MLIRLMPDKSALGACLFLSLVALSSSFSTGPFFHGKISGVHGAHSQAVASFGSCSRRAPSRAVTMVAGYSGTVVDKVRNAPLLAWLLNILPLTLSCKKVDEWIRGQTVGGLLGKDELKQLLREVCATFFLCLHFSSRMFDKLCDVCNSSGATKLSGILKSPNLMTSGSRCVSHRIALLAGSSASHILSSCALNQTTTYFEKPVVKIGSEIGIR